MLSTLMISTLMILKYLTNKLNALSKQPSNPSQLVPLEFFWDHEKNVFYLHKKSEGILCGHIARNVISRIIYSYLVD